ncbi:MAG: energy transducer TonB [Wenzhouxiangella sp.]
MPIHRSVPAWPHVAAMMCLEGTVVLEFTVGSNGLVRDAVVIESDQPGVFDRAAINATQQWVYRPRCEGGVAVEVQQRTALDFLFTDEERARCLPGAALLSGKALELASALGFLYSLMAEWQLNPHQADWPAQIEAALVPRFDGDLGRVERFHHEYIASLVAVYRAPQNDFLLAGLERLRALRDELARAELPVSDLGKLMLSDLFRRDAEFQQQQAYRIGLVAQFGLLDTEVDLDSDLLDVLILPFVGNIRSATEAGLMSDRSMPFEDLLLMLEATVGQWTAAEMGIRYSDPEDQQRFMELLEKALRADREIQDGWQQFLLGFMDYR